MALKLSLTLKLVDCCFLSLIAGPPRPGYVKVAVVGPSSVVRPVVISGKLSKRDPYSYSGTLLGSKDGTE